MERLNKKKWSYNNKWIQYNLTCLFYWSIQQLIHRPIYLSNDQLINNISNYENAIWFFLIRRQKLQNISPPSFTYKKT